MKHGFCALSPWCALIGWHHGNGGLPQLLHISVLAVMLTAWMFANVIILWLCDKNIISLGTWIGVATLSITTIGSLLMWFVRSVQGNTVLRVLLPMAGEHMMHSCCQGKTKGGKHKVCIRHDYCIRKCFY